MLNNQTYNLGLIMDNISNITLVPLTINNKASNAKCNDITTNITIYLGEKIAFH
jgi:hypothetical protein